jgi:hypothetical protein
VNQVVVEGMLVIAAGRAYVSSRPPVLARPRRGSADLPDRDAPDRTAPQETAVTPRQHASDRWGLPASAGLVVLVSGIVAGTARVLI